MPLASTTHAAVTLTSGRALLVTLAGLGAGIMNGAAGGGTMLSFPALLGLGYPAFSANITSTVGIWPGSVGGMVGFRTEIAAQRSRLLWLLPVAVVGAVAGAALLLTTPQSAFARIAPWLLIAATALFAVQPLLARLLGHVGHDHPTRRWLGQGGTFMTSLYGGYFGAGMGVLYLAVLGLALPDTIARTSGLRSVLSVVANAVAALIFVIRGHLPWEVVGLLALGSFVGGVVGSMAAHRIPSVALRIVVIGIGIATAVNLLAG